MIEINWQPSKKELRTFGLAFLVAGLLVGGILSWRFGLGWWSWALWTAGPLAALVGLVAPRALKPVYILLTVLAWPIGMVIGTLLLALTYYLVVTPIGLAFKLLRKDPMHRRFDREAASYWIERKPPARVGRYFQQF